MIETLLKMGFAQTLENNIYSWDVTSSDNETLLFTVSALVESPCKAYIGISIRVGNQIYRTDSKIEIMPFDVKAETKIRALAEIAIREGLSEINKKIIQCFEAETTREHLKSEIK